MGDKYTCDVCGHVQNNGIDDCLRCILFPVGFAKLEHMVIRSIVEFAMSLLLVAVISVFTIKNIVLGDLYSVNKTVSSFTLSLNILTVAFAFGYYIRVKKYRAIYSFASKQKAAANEEE